MTEPITVLVADDHARMRALIRAELEREDDFVVCAEAADAGAAIAAAAEIFPSVCLLDIEMPGNGIAAAGAISAAHPDTAVVMLTVSRQDSDLFDALRAGAKGYLLKGGSEGIAGALRRVLRGEVALPGTLVARLVEEFRDRETRRVPIAGGVAARLTGREWDVLELLREGCSTAEIGDRLFISPTTVRTHVSSVLRKLRVADRSEAVKLLE